MFVLSFNDKRLDSVWNSILIFDSKESLINYFLMDMYSKTMLTNISLEYKEEIFNNINNYINNNISANDLYKKYLSRHFSIGRVGIYKAYEIPVKNTSLDDLKFYVNILDVLDEK